jgi:DNA-binding response OmpR family regulator
MLSDDLRLAPHQKRVLDALERANGRALDRAFMKQAMYPPPADVPAEADGVLKVIVCQLRKIMTKAGSLRQIETVWTRGYRLGP